MTTPYDQLDQWIAAHFDEEVRFLQALVRVPTDTPPGDNAPHAERTAELLAGFGLAAERHAVSADEVHAQSMQSITNLIVRRRYGDGGPVVALNAHGDVVPPGEGWTHDPYGGEVAGGKLYGRAAAVSKSDFATYTFALRALESLGLPLKGGVELHQARRVAVLQDPPARPTGTVEDRLNSPGLRVCRRRYPAWAALGWHMVGGDDWLLSVAAAAQQPKPSDRITV